MRKSGDLSRQALLEASCRLFAERGMTVVKLSEIAREAGVDACMVNYHFGGKEGLIDAVVDVALGRWKQVDLRKYYEENGPLLETREGQKVFVTGMVDCVFQKLCGGDDDPSRCLLLQLLQHPSEMRTRIVEVEELTGEKIMLTGASRTDSGVHALGQVAVFDTKKIWPAERFVPALNQRLPKDIVIQSAEEVEPDFHPRYQNTVKTYEYRILNSRVPVPTERMYSYFVPQKLDVEAMREAAEEILGKHDFHNFSSTKTKVKDTVRTITDISLKKEGDMIYLRITGDGFLYNMVRIIVGGLLKVGFHKKTKEDIRRSLESEERYVVGSTAPPQGLTLVNIEYLE